MPIQPRGGLGRIKTCGRWWFEISTQGETLRSVHLIKLVYSVKSFPDSLNHQRHHTPFHTRSESPRQVSSDLEICPRCLLGDVCILSSTRDRGVGLKLGQPPRPSHHCSFLSSSSSLMSQLGFLGLTPSSPLTWLTQLRTPVSFPPFIYIGTISPLRECYPLGGPPTVSRECERHPFDMNFILFAFKIGGTMPMSVWGAEHSNHL